MAPTLTDDALASRPRSHLRTPLTTSAYRAPREQEGLGMLRDLFIKGSLRSVIELQLPLERVVEGHRHYETGRTRGKIVLTV